MERPPTSKRRRHPRHLNDPAFANCPLCGEPIRRVVQGVRGIPYCSHMCADADAVRIGLDFNLTYVNDVLAVDSLGSPHPNAEITYVTRSGVVGKLPIPHGLDDHCWSLLRDLELHSGNYASWNEVGVRDGDFCLTPVLAANAIYKCTGLLLIRHLPEVPGFIVTNTGLFALKEHHRAHQIAKDHERAAQNLLRYSQK